MTKDIKTEILAGLSTFLTMSYIIFVNPSILATEGTGMSFSGVMTATVIVSFLSTLAMGLFAKLPFALAPGMGINAFFTYTLVLGQEIPYQTALGMVFWSGLLFIAISVTPLRVMIVKAIPDHLRQAMAIGIGCFLTFIGFKNIGLIVDSPATLVTQSKFSLEMIISFLGLFLMAKLFRRKNPAAFLIGIASISIAALAFGKIKVPEYLFSSPDFQSVFFKLDIMSALKFSLIPNIFALIMTDMFDSISTFIGVSKSSGLVDQDGEPKNIKKALLVDAFATFISSIFGTSPATTYVESASGVQAGGKSGKTAVVAALCFLPFLFLAPLVGMVPPYATAPVLIIVGCLMFKNVVHLPLEKLEEVLPAFFVIILIPLTFSITHGIVWGFLAHLMMFSVTGRIKEIHPILFVVTILGILSF